MSLQQQIQREIDEEARIEKRIENLKKKFFKKPQNRKFRLVESKDKAHAYLVLNRNDLSTYHVVSKEEDKTLSKCENTPGLVVFLLRNTNPHDSKNTTNGDIRKNLTPTSRLKVRKT